MGQLNSFFRSEEGGRVSHWCPGCREMHGFRLGTKNDGWHLVAGSKLDCPTIQPSIKITGVQTVVDDKGEWTGEWMRDAAGKAIPYCCHYIITKGKIGFQPDCTHKLRGQTVALPPLPAFVRDDYAP